MMLIDSDFASPHIGYGFFTRQGGCSTGIYSSLNCGLGSGDDVEIVYKNRALVAQKLMVAPECLLSPHQYHSCEVATIDQSWCQRLGGPQSQKNQEWLGGPQSQKNQERLGFAQSQGQEAERPRADGLVTNVPGLAVGVLTADCAPVLFVDPQAMIIGAAHAGWRGAFSGIGEATISAMIALGAQRSRIIAQIGPTISQQSYEVSREFKENFLVQSLKNGNFFIPSHRNEHFMFDLPGYLTERLRACHIGRIIEVARCTFAEEDLFFSYRRTSLAGQCDYGRQISAIVIHKRRDKE